MNYKGIKDREYICLNCDSAFKRTTYDKKNIPKFCCLPCQHDHRKKESSRIFEVGMITSSEAQRRILTEKYGYKCTICSIDEWEGSPLTLQVDHIDGNPGNNLGNNLRLLCPNCHSQTPTYKGSNRKILKMDKRSIMHREIYNKNKLLISD